MGRAQIVVGPGTNVVTDRPEEVSRAIERAGGYMAAGVATRITMRLMDVTPRKTGLASASWIPSVGLPTSLRGGDKYKVDPSVQQRALTRLLSYEISQGQIFICNNQPYIMKLNGGSSAQEPAGFIERAIDDESASFDVIDVKF